MSTTLIQRHPAVEAINFHCNRMAVLTVRMKTGSDELLITPQADDLTAINHALYWTKDMVENGWCAEVVKVNDKPIHYLEVCKMVDNWIATITSQIGRKVA